jgi:hypothetical protein
MMSPAEHRESLRGGIRAQPWEKSNAGGLGALGRGSACGHHLALLEPGQSDPQSVPHTVRPAGWKSGADPARERQQCRPQSREGVSRDRRSGRPWDTAVVGLMGQSATPSVVDDSACSPSSPGDLILYPRDARPL